MPEWNPEYRKPFHVSRFTLADLSAEALAKADYVTLFNNRNASLVLCAILKKDNMRKKAMNN